MTLRVAHTVSSIEHMGSGITYCVTGLAAAQAQCGAKPALFSIGRMSAGYTSDYEDRRFRNDLAAIPILNKLGMSTAMRQELCNSDVDIVNTHGLWTMSNVYRANGTPFVITPHGMLTSVALSFSPRKKRLFRLLFQDRAFAAASLFQATAESEYEDIRRFGLRQPIAIIPNGIDLPSIGPAQRSEKTVLSLGRIHPKKALDTLIQAWAKIEQGFPDWRLKIVGPDEGGHAAELSALVRNLGLTTVLIEPPVFGDEKAELMARADVFALPSHSENFGMTVAESLAAGVPVISTKGAPWALLEAHRCGWWIDHGPEALATTLHAALSLPETERRNMGARGRSWMEQDFSWSSKAQMSLQAYEWILGRGDKPDFVKVD